MPRRSRRIASAFAALFGASACAPAIRPLATTPTASPASPTAASAPASAAPVTSSREPARAKSAVATAPSPTVAAPAHEHLPGVTFGLGVHEYESDERVARYVKRFTGPERAEFVALLERGTRYEGMIRAKLRAAGLPEEMRYLALIESGYDPNAVSRVGAVGMWQFMAGTARDVGLRVDAWVDERRDPIRATDAAAKNLRWLRSQFGSMFLAAAAYNGGETRVSRGLAQLAVDDSTRAATERADLADAVVDSAAETVDAAVAAAPVSTFAAEATHTTVPNVVDGESTADARYFALSSAGYIRPQTQNYVPQLIAVVLVANEPARYGITVKPQPAFAYDSVRVAPLTPLAAVADAAETTRDQLLDLNPQVLRGLTPPGSPVVLRVPVGRGASTLRRLDDMPSSERRAFRRLTTRKRESLSALAERAGVPARAIQRYNPELETVKSGKSKGRFVSGQGVRVPTRAVLAYARDIDDGSNLTGLPMPEPEPDVSKATKGTATNRKSTNRTATTDTATTSKRPSDTKASSSKSKPGTGKVSKAVKGKSAKPKTTKATTTKATTTKAKAK